MNTRIARVGTPWSAVALGAAAAVVLSAAQPAEACSCLLPEVGAASPADGALDVPTNAPIFLPDSNLGEPDNDAEAVLLDDGDNEVALVRSRLGGSQGLGIDVLRPDSELAPATSYRLMSSNEELAEELVSFTTGDASDTVKPSVPVVSVVSAVSETFGPGMTTSCGDEFHHATLSIETDGLYTVVALDPGVELDEAALSGELFQIMPGDASEWMVGSGGCIFNWPEATGGASRDFFFGSLDEAGNFSGWGEAVEVVLPATTLTGTGCACVSSADVDLRLGAGLLALLVVGFRMRRR